MKIKIIDFGYENMPLRAHDNDAGMDVCATRNYDIAPHETVKIGLGLGVEIPDGYMGLIFPRSGLSSRGICCQLPPIDSGYRGEIHAIVTNYNDTGTFNVKKGDRIGQLVVLPIVICDLVTDRGKERGNDGFGSTG